ncbi:hypothetical protein DL769_002179 [Monosporascus sp. CRB-8-3]|nr:hypothetical protein DL769_002179 [Monosporascus sp. CRB-8-3]
MPKPTAQPNLVDLGRRLASEGPVRTLRTPRRVRILFGGAWVADTTAALYVWEHPWYPWFYVPRADFAPGRLHSRRQDESPSEGFEIVELRAGGRSTDRVLAFGSHVGETGPERKEGEGGKALCDMVRVEFGAADAWFEEDAPVVVHPRDPFRRVDVLHSTRPVRVLVGNEVRTEVVRAAASFHLYETGLPCRFYLPATSVDRTVLRKSATRTMCPYKGEAEYYDVVLRGNDGEEEVYEDLVWYYRTPAPECALVAGCLCFYNEKVDIELDGKLLERPKTPFS